MLRILKWKGLRDSLVGIALLISAAALILAPKEALNGAKSGLDLCFNVIVPSLFPFFVLSSLVIDLGLAAYLGRSLEHIMRPLFRVNGSCAAAMILGFIGGYPVGARTALQLYQQGQCSKTEAERMLAFCNNSGPAFILGVVGAGIFGDSRVGFLLYLTHAAASVLVGILFRFYGGLSNGKTGPAKYQKPINTVTIPSAFTGAVTRSFQNTMNICGFVIFFAVVLQLLSRFGILDALANLLTGLGFEGNWARQLVAGLLELSSGVSSLSSAGNFAAKTSLAAFMLGWAGLSIHCQVLSFLVDSDLSARIYLLGKFCHGLFAATLTWILIKIIPISEPVSYYLIQQTESLAAIDFSSAFTASIVIAFGTWLLFSIVSLLQIQKRSRKKS